jgi:pimeloyl-ACP methyl ester carboxylesterase
MKRAIGWYFAMVSWISPRMAGKQAFEFFQRTFPKSKRIKGRELMFYNENKAFVLETINDSIHCFELGDPSHPMVFVVHGWNSNPGSMYTIAKQLVQAGCYVVLPELPAHGRSTAKKTNLLRCSEAFLIAVNRLLLGRSFSVVSHSFGSAVVSYALAVSHQQVDRWVMLTSPNELCVIFREYQAFIRLSEKAYRHLSDKVHEVLKETLETVSVAEKIQHIDINALLIIHDRYDRVLPFKNAQSIACSVEKAEVVGMERIGHYRMLTNPQVLEYMDAFLKPKNFLKLRTKDQASMLN